MQQRRLIAASLLLHLGMFGLLLVHRHVAVEPIRLPGTADGKRISLTYSPGRAAAETFLAAKTLTPVKPVPLIKSQKRVEMQASVSRSSTPSAAPNAAQGGDARGSGEVTVALATFFPAPKPDLSGLARGTRGDVIVDVVIDEQGRIVDSQIARSLGQKIDDAVLATIQSWTFKPATKNGIAVPSEQELLFHYERG